MWELEDYVFRIDKFSNKTLNKFREKNDLFPIII